MPIIGLDDDIPMDINTQGTFGYSAVRLDTLGASQYTIVTLVVDVSGSLIGSEDQLLKLEKMVISACRRSPFSDNILVRKVRFNTVLDECHGFMPLTGIDENTYTPVVCGGSTALYDAISSAVEGTVLFSEQLYSADYLTNAITVVITDGLDCASLKATVNSTAALIKGALKDERIESLKTILIGMETAGMTYHPQRRMATTIGEVLKDLANDIGCDYVDGGSVTPDQIARLADFISQSISATSQALGTGGPSQAVVTLDI